VARLEPLPAKIGRYEIQGELGRGMMGVVYRAQDPDLGRTVALKSVRLAFTVSEEEREAFEQRFLTEARAAAALSHPGIVVVHDVGRDAATGTLYMAMEYLGGRTLAQMTAGGSPIEWSTALGLVARAAAALDAAHAYGIIHRDIKPANIMVLDSGEPKIMDFGIAKVPAAHLTTAGQFFGTPSYMSPEQASNEPLDGRSDLFALGAVLYLLLTGRMAFEAESVPTTLARILYHRPPPPSRLVSGVPPALDGVLERVLAKNPEDRYRDGRTFAEDLQDVLAGREPRHLGALPTPAGAATRVSHATPSAPEPSLGGDRAAADDGLLRRFSGWLGGRSFAPVAGLAAAGLLAMLLIASAVWPRIPGCPALVAPARLELDFQHSLRSGTLKVWIDDELALEEPLEGWVKKDLLVVKLWSGRERKTLEVRPGEHEVRLEVTGQGFVWSRSIRGQLDGGATRRLDARLEGMLEKELTVTWGS
jgi:predicted Ser/Thr protein kinase